MTISPTAPAAPNRRPTATASPPAAREPGDFLAMLDEALSSPARTTRRGDRTERTDPGRRGDAADRTERPQRAGPPRLPDGDEPVAQTEADRTDALEPGRPIRKGRRARRDPAAEPAPPGAAGGPSPAVADEAGTAPAVDATEEDGRAVLLGSGSGRPTDLDAGTASGTPAPSVLPPSTVLPGPLPGPWGPGSLPTPPKDAATAPGRTPDPLERPAAPVADTDPQGHGLHPDATVPVPANGPGTGATVTALARPGPRSTPTGTARPGDRATGASALSAAPGPRPDDPVAVLPPIDGRPVRPIAADPAGVDAWPGTAPAPIAFAGPPRHVAPVETAAAAATPPPGPAIPARALGGPLPTPAPAGPADPDLAPLAAAAPPVPAVFAAPLDVVAPGRATPSDDPVLPPVDAGRSGEVVDAGRTDPLDDPSVAPPVDLLVDAGTAAGPGPAPGGSAVPTAGVPAALTAVGEPPGVSAQTSAPVGSQDSGDHVETVTAGPTGPGPAGSRLVDGPDRPRAEGASASPAQPPVADQVLRHLTAFRTLRDGTQRTVLRLSPDHLGTLTMTVDVQAGAVHLTVEGNDTALAALRDGTAQLREQLSQAGLDLRDLSLRQDTADPGRGQARPWDDADTRSGGRAPQGRSGEAARPARNDRIPAGNATSAGRPGGLDVLA